MKYKVLLIAICITRIGTAIGDEQEKSNVGKPGQDIKLIDHGQDKSGAQMNKAAMKSKIRTDKNGNKWIYDENSGEWMHLPQHAFPMQSNGFNVNGLNVDGPNREEDFEDEAFPGVYNPVFQLKGPQKPIINSNTQSIYGPQYPSGYHPNDYINQINQGSGIYGPMPPPNGLDSEDDFNPNVIPWQQTNNLSNQFPIPGGPSYPDPVDSGRPNTQTKPPKNIRNRPTPSLDTFEDPFDGEPHKRPKKVRKITRIPTTTEMFDNDLSLPVITNGPNFEPIFDHDIVIHPINNVFGDFSEILPSVKPSQKPSPFKKPIRKPIIIKVPVSPVGSVQDPYNYWTGIARSPTQKPTMSPVNTDSETPEDNNESDTVELYPPVPPEYPNFVYPNPNAGTKSTVLPSAETVKREVEWTAITAVTEKTTTKTTPSTLSTTVTIPTTTTALPTQELTEGSTKDQNNSQVLVPNNNENSGPKKDPNTETIEEWKPVTLLGKRRQTPVPIINFPTVSPALEESWRPVESWRPAIRPHQAPDTLGSIGNGGGLMPQSEDASTWVRPSMDTMNVMGFPTKRVIPLTTTTTTTTSTVALTTKRKSVPKKKVVTKIATPTTTELPTTLTAKKKSQKQKSKPVTILIPKTTSTKTTTTEATTTTRKKKVKSPKRKLKPVVQSTTQAVIPEETEIDYTDYSESNGNQVTDEVTELDEETETEENTSDQNEQGNTEESEDHTGQTAEENAEEQTSEEESPTENNAEEVTETGDEVEEEDVTEDNENQTDGPKESDEQSADQSTEGQTESEEEEEVESEEDEPKEGEESEEEPEDEEVKPETKPEKEKEKEPLTKVKQKTGEWQNIIPVQNKNQKTSAKKKSN